MPVFTAFSRFFVTKQDTAKHSQACWKDTSAEFTAKKHSKTQYTQDDWTMSVYRPDMYRAFHAGINDCEGINRFYEMSVDGTEAE